MLLLTVNNITASSIVDRIQHLLLEVINLKSTNSFNNTSNATTTLITTDSSSFSSSEVWKQLEIESKIIEILSLLYQLANDNNNVYNNNNNNNSSNNNNESDLDLLLDDKIWQQCFYSKINNYKQRIQYLTYQYKNDDNLQTFKKLTHTCQSFH